MGVIHDEDFTIEWIILNIYTWKITLSLEKGTNYVQVRGKNNGQLFRGTRGLDCGLMVW